MLWTTVLMALREIRRNGLRSLLTMLGVVIGVGAVIALVSVGRGATQKVTEDISKLGKNLLTVSAGARVRGGASTSAGPLSLRDADAILHDVMGVQAVAPGVQSQQQVIFGDKNVSTQIAGSDINFFTVRGYEVQHGRSYTAAEAKSGVPVCLLGETVRVGVFGAQDGIGSMIRIGRLTCQVIGTLVPKGSAGLGMDQDDLVLMPLRTFQRRISGRPDISTIYVAAAEGRNTTTIAERIRELLRQRRHRPAGSDDDFTVRDMAEIADTVTSTSNALTALLGAIAAVSLLVGGIGIMNIMLVSVTERTREIGIRLAIGAFAGEVMMQFLLEATVLSTLGGIVGMILGLIGSFFAARAMELPFVAPPDIVALAFAFSALVGVFFGYVPARKAAQLNPIEALRHE